MSGATEAYLGPACSGTRPRVRHLKLVEDYTIHITCDQGLADTRRMFLRANSIQ